VEEKRMLFASDFGTGEVLWSVFVIVLPYFGVFIYMIARGPQMQERAIAEQQAQKQAMDAYIRSVANTPVAGS
jgi:ABC-type Fe3+ transport system permease subunit